MRFLSVIVTCLLLAGTAMAQTSSDAECLDLSELAGQPAGVFWANSFSVFQQAHQGELSAAQSRLVQKAIDFGSSRGSELNNSLSINKMKALLGEARKTLTDDQFAEILAGMGAETQRFLADIGAIKAAVIYCSCTAGGSDCPPEGPCKVGCQTWGTGRWNGLCTGAETIPQ